MKLLNVILTGGALLMGTGIHAAEAADAASDSATYKEKASYGVGVNVAKRFKHEFIDLDIDAFVRGFRDSLSDAKPAYTDEEIEQALLKLRDQVAERTAKQGEENQKAAQEFLAENKLLGFAPGEGFKLAPGEVRPDMPHPAFERIHELRAIELNNTV